QNDRGDGPKKGQRREIDRAASPERLDDGDTERVGVSGDRDEHDLRAPGFGDATALQNECKETQHLQTVKSHGMRHLELAGRADDAGPEDILDGEAVPDDGESEELADREGDHARPDGE